MSERNLNAYYYSFDPTGNDDVDAILEAVARAGKAYHHTSEWNDDTDWQGNGVKSEAQKIQEAAQALADKLARLEGA